MWRSPRDDHEHGRRPEEKASLKRKRLLAVVGVQFMPASFDDLAESSPRRALEQHEPPWSELAVIRHAHGDFENGLELFRRRSRLAHSLDGSRLARPKQVKGRRRVIEACHVP